MQEVNLTVLLQDIARLWPEVQKNAGLPNDMTATANKYIGGCYLAIWSPRLYLDNLDLGRELLATMLENCGYVIVRKAPAAKCVVGIK